MGGNIELPSYIFPDIPKSSSNKVLATTLFVLIQSLVPINFFFRIKATKNIKLTMTPPITIKTILICRVGSILAIGGKTPLRKRNPPSAPIGRRINANIS